MTMTLVTLSEILVILTNDQVTGLVRHDNDTSDCHRSWSSSSPMIKSLDLSDMTMTLVTLSPILVILLIMINSLDLPDMTMTLVTLSEILVILTNDQVTGLVRHDNDTSDCHRSWSSSPMIKSLDLPDMTMTLVTVTDPGHPPHQ